MRDLHILRNFYLKPVSKQDKQMLVYKRQADNKKRKNREKKQKHYWSIQHAKNEELKLMRERVKQTGTIGISV